jgi:tripartite-type tricarboxylate transporter receptor subunit TctC
VVVENVAGAGGNTAAVARAPRDGYTIMVTAAAWRSRRLGRHQASFDVARDLAPIAQLATVPLLPGPIRR